MDSGNIYAIPAIISTFLYVYLVFLLLKIDSKSTLNRISVLFFAILGFWSFSEWMLRWSDKYDTALLWASMIMLCILILPPVLIHLSLIFPWSKKDVTPAIYGLYGFSVLLLGIHINSRLFVSDVNRYFAGYGTVLGPYGIFAYLYLAAFSLLVLLILMVRYANTESKIAMHQIKIVIIGFSITYIFVFFTGLMPYLCGNLDTYPWTTPSFLVMGSVLAYAIWKYHIFLPEPEKEHGEESKNNASGLSVLPRDKAMLRFYGLVHSGNKGMCITARMPDTIMEEMDLKSVPIIALKDIKDKIDINTEYGRSMIPFIISDILRNKGVVIMIDGFDKVLSPNDFKDMLSDLKSLELKDSMIILSIER